MYIICLKIIPLIGDIPIWFKGQGMKGLIILGITVLAAYADKVHPRDCIIDVGFVLDSSRAIKSWDWYMTLSFVKKFARHVVFSQKGTRIGIISFGSHAKVEVPLDKFNTEQAFESYVAKIPYRDEDRNTAAGLKALRKQLFVKEKGDRLRVQNVAILVTNGKPTMDIVATVPEATALKESGIQLFVLAVGSHINRQQVRAIASAPYRSYLFEVNRFKDLHDKINTIVNATCQMQSGTVVWSCSFETKPYRCNIQDDKRSHVTWTRWSSSTPTPKTGPSSAYDGKYYIYIDSSKPGVHGKKAVMYLPVRSDGSFCVSFYYHMYGKTIGALQVFVKTNTTETIVWKMKGEKGPDWIFGEASVNLHEKDKVGIRGICGKGDTSDIALDFLQIRRGFCPGDI